jgi:hypothetical protein
MAKGRGFVQPIFVKLRLIEPDLEFVVLNLFDGDGELIDWRGSRESAHMFFCLIAVSSLVNSACAAAACPESRQTKKHSSASRKQRTASSKPAPGSSSACLA